MNEQSHKLLNKIKIDTYIYTFSFMAVSVLYIVKFSVGTVAIMLLLASFAFYTLGRQVNLMNQLESGEKINTMPTAPVWVRGVTYFVVMMLVIALIFCFV